jgi:L-alanine-DL-glutamate epimerase-like enolase superfamily enzyme
LGVEGFYGPLDREVIAPLTAVIAGQLLGLDALGGSFIWDLLNRSNRHARHGSYKIAISAVDNALWDLRGKIAGLPVWQLLGGGGRRAIPAYASTLGTGHEDGEVERVAAALVQQGYSGQKWFFADGPGQGADGLARNIALAERARAGAGPQSGLMFDAFMSWDVPYAQAWCSAVEHLRPDWLEEPFAPGDIESYARLQAGTRVPLATGEHFYDRQDMLPYLVRRILTVVQCDPEWCGGVTELARMADLADSFGVPLVPHGHGLHAALHVVASRSPQVCPRLEYLYLVEEERHWFEIDPPHPRNGQFDLPTAPGFAIDLDPSRVESTTDVFAVD